MKSSTVNVIKVTYRLSRANKLHGLQLPLQQQKSKTHNVSGLLCWFNLIPQVNLV